MLDQESYSLPAPLTPQAQDKDLSLPSFPASWSLSVSAQPSACCGLDALNEQKFKSTRYLNLLLLWKSCCCNFATQDCDTCTTFLLKFSSRPCLRCITISKYLDAHSSLRVKAIPQKNWRSTNLPVCMSSGKYCIISWSFFTKCKTLATASSSQRLWISLLLTCSIVRTFLSSARICCRNFSRVYLGLGSQQLPKIENDQRWVEGYLHWYTI